MDIQISKQIAKLLLKINAVNLREYHAYSWTSGIKSPVYCDNRIILSYPDIRRYICKNISNYIKENFKNVDCIAGIATGSIAISSIIADYIDKPFVYVRQSKKSHGTKKTIEGVFKTGDDIILIEDLISTGKSSINSFKSLKDQGANVIKLISIFSYGFVSTVEILKDEGIDFIYLCDFSNVLDEAISSGYISKNKATFFHNWFEDTNRELKKAKKN